MHLGQIHPWAAQKERKRHISATCVSDQPISILFLDFVLPCTHSLYRVLQRIDYWYSILFPEQRRIYFARIATWWINRLKAVSVLLRDTRLMATTGASLSSPVVPYGKDNIKVQLSTLLVLKETSILVAGCDPSGIIAQRPPHRQSCKETTPETTVVSGRSTLRYREPVYFVVYVCISHH